MVGYFHKTNFWPLPVDPFSDTEMNQIERLVKDVNFCKDAMMLKGGNLQSGYNKVATKAKNAQIFLRHNEDLAEFFVVLDLPGMDVEVAAILKKTNFLGNCTFVDLKNDHSY